MMSRETQTILITGANGLLGQKLVNQLRKDDEVHLIATGRGPSRLPGKWEVKYETMDITDPGRVMEVVTGASPDVVIHTAAMTNVDQCEGERGKCWAQNVTAVEHIVKACERSGAFLLHLSTDFIFDGSKGPLKETESPAPVNYYGETKLASEEVVIRSSLDWAIARTVLVYGITENMSRSNIILWVKKSLEEGKEIQVVDDQYRTPTLAEDLASGCILIAKQKKKGIFNISGKDFLTPFDMAIATAEYFHLDRKLISRTDSRTFTQPAARPLKTGFVIDKAISELGYCPRSFKEGLAIVDHQLKK